MRFLSVCFAILILAAPAPGQTSVKVEEIKPDCTIYFTLTSASPNSVTFDNRQAGCTSWTYTYLNNGFGALSLALRQAPDAAGVPGVWANFAGAILSGANPQVAITQATATAFGYAPWIRMTATVAGAGTITGRLYGFRQPSAVLLAGGPGPGGAFLGYVGCTQHLIFNTALAGNIQIVPLVATQVIRVCHISLSTTPAEDILFNYGTGANCAVGTTALTGTYRSVLGMALDLAGSLIVPAGNALCINQANAQNVGGVITFAQYAP